MAGLADCGTVFPGMHSAAFFRETDTRDSQNRGSNNDFVISDRFFREICLLHGSAVDAVDLHHGVFLLVHRTAGGRDIGAALALQSKIRR